MQKPFELITFNTRNLAAGAYSFLKKNGLEAALMPTPRTLTASCGLSIRFSLEDLLKVKSLLENFCDFEQLNFYHAKIVDEKPVYVNFRSF